MSINIIILVLGQELFYNLNQSLIYFIKIHGISVTSIINFILNNFLLSDHSDLSIKIIDRLLLIFNEIKKQFQKHKALH